MATTHHWHARVRFVHQSISQSHCQSFCVFIHPLVYRSSICQWCRSRSSGQSNPTFRKCTFAKCPLPLFPFYRYRWLSKICIFTFKPLAWSHLVASELLHMPLCLSIYLSACCLSSCLPIHSSIYLSMCPLAVSVPICLSVCFTLCLCLSVVLSLVMVYSTQSMYWHHTNYKKSKQRLRPAKLKEHSPTKHM